MKAVFRVCASAIGLVLATATTSLESDSGPTWTGGSMSSEPANGATPASPMACCKICTKGKACGNSCISQDKYCHQPPGCACDG
jgi:hypothetical protein